MQVSFHYEWPCYSKVLTKISLTCIGPETFPSVPVKVQVSSKICSIVCSFVFFCSGETWASTRTRVGIFLHNFGNSSPLWRCLKSLWTSIPPEHLPKVLQCFLSNAPLMKMSIKSVRCRVGTGTKYHELFPRAFPRCSWLCPPRVHPQGTHIICFWTASGCCPCNRCNFMVNVLYLPFATSVAVHRRPLASKEVFWANFSCEEKLESSFPFFFPYPLRKIR